jgi:hypothetical protein
MADVFVRHLATGTTERVNVGSAGAEAHGNLFYPPAISGDGRFVAFTTSAGDLVPGDTNGRIDVFVRDRQLGITERASVGPAGVQANQDSFLGTGASLSLDGRFVAFTSAASNLVPTDFNGRWDVFLRDRSSATTEILSLTRREPGNGDSPRLSGARYVAFASFASNLADRSLRLSDIFLRDRTSGTTECMSVDPDGIPGIPPPDSRRSRGRPGIAFESVADDLVPDNERVMDVFPPRPDADFHELLRRDRSHACPWQLGGAGAAAKTRVDG